MDPSSLIFIVPLRHRSTCRDWSFISRLCERSLRSFCGQRGATCRVFLVCRDRPEIDFEHPSLTIISEDFPDPGPEHTPREEDKWRKLKRGLIAARPFAPAHIMFADADDLVHRDLAQLVAKSPSSHGWYVPLGYAYDEPSRWVHRWPDFDLWCGTSSIIRCEADDLPVTMEDPRERFFMLTQGHPVIREFMQKRGTPLTPTPWPAVIYLTGTGENHGGFAVAGLKGKKMMLKKLLRARPVTGTLRADFGLYPLGGVAAPTAS